MRPWEAHESQGVPEQYAVGMGPGSSELTADGLQLRLCRYHRSKALAWHCCLVAVAGWFSLRLWAGHDELGKAVLLSRPRGW